MIELRIIDNENGKDKRRKFILSLITNDVLGEEIKTKASKAKKYIIHKVKDFSIMIELKVCFFS